MGVGEVVGLIEEKREGTKSLSCSQDSLQGITIDAEDTPEGARLVISMARLKATSKVLPIVTSTPPDCTIWELPFLS